MNSCAAEALSRKLLSCLKGGRNKKVGFGTVRAVGFEEFGLQRGFGGVGLVGSADSLRL